MAFRRSLACALLGTGLSLFSGGCSGVVEYVAKPVTEPLAKLVGDDGQNEYVLRVIGNQAGFELNGQNRGREYSVRLDDTEIKAIVDLDNQCIDIIEPNGLVVRASGYRGKETIGVGCMEFTNPHAKDVAREIANRVARRVYRQQQVYKDSLNERLARK